jgi:ubiquinone biosynthesis protein
VDPEFHFVESVTPFAERLVKEQMRPDVVARGFASTLRHSLRALKGLPENVSRVLRRLGDGDLRMTVRPAGLDPVMSRLEQSVDRLAFALVVSAFVVGFSTLLSRVQIPWWVQFIAEFALVCAAGVGIWFFLSILLRAVRQRKHD